MVYIPIFIIFFVGLYCLSKNLIITYWRRKRMGIYHYLEYSFMGKKITTRENGPLNDLAGVGLINEISQRGGSLLIHFTGSEIEVMEYIDYVYYTEKQESLHETSKPVRNLNNYNAYRS